MYASVEMLLKFCAENFSSNCTGTFLRQKCGQAHTPRICNEEIWHWRSRYFTRSLCTATIQFASVNLSTTIFPEFMRDDVRAGRNVR